ncbi:hypothetical protein ON010_g12387 [Phytophthora cinnamomi]|nr:hypothetical protein ON010_g12387 [Phytophthora cinnamomi]
MPGFRLAKTMSEKKGVVTWIEEHQEVPARAARKNFRLSLTNGNRRTACSTRKVETRSSLKLQTLLTAGFVPCYQDWHISRHDVYGELFYRKWLSRDDDSDDNDVEEDLLENLDEFTIWDSEDSA